MNLEMFREMGLRECGMFDGWPGESPQEQDAERILASQDCAYYVSGRLCIELKAIIISWLKNIVYFPSNF